MLPTEETATVEPPERVEGVAVTAQLTVSMPSACVAIGRGERGRERVLVWNKGGIKR